MSVALRLFDDLCVVGNDLEAYRDTYAPGSDAWTALTDMLGMLDEAIDLLVHSDGLEEDA